MKLRAVYFGARRISEAYLGTLRVLLAGYVGAAAYGWLLFLPSAVGRADGTAHGLTMALAVAIGGGTLAANGAAPGYGRGTIRVIGDGKMWAQMPARGSGQILTGGTSTGRGDDSAPGFAVWLLRTLQVAEGYAADPEKPVDELLLALGTAEAISQGVEHGAAGLIFALSTAGGYAQDAGNGTKDELIILDGHSAAFAADPVTPEIGYILYLTSQIGRAAASAAGNAHTVIWADLRGQAFAAAPSVTGCGLLLTVGSSHARLPNSAVASALALSLMLSASDGRSAKVGPSAGIGVALTFGRAGNLAQLTFGDAETDSDTELCADGSESRTSSSAAASGSGMIAFGGYANAIVSSSVWYDPVQTGSSVYVRSVAHPVQTGSSVYIGREE